MKMSSMKYAKPVGVQTEARAHMIAQRLESNEKMMGLNAGSIVTVLIELLPTLISCFDPDDGQQAVQYVTQRYDDSKKGDQDRGYRRGLARTMARRAKMSARKKRQRITWDQAREMGFAALDDVRLGDPHQVSVAIAENHDFMLV